MSEEPKTKIEINEDTENVLNRLFVGNNYNEAVIQAGVILLSKDTQTTHTILSQLEILRSSSQEVFLATWNDFQEVTMENMSIPPNILAARKIANENMQVVGGKGVDDMRVLRLAVNQFIIDLDAYHIPLDEA